MKTWMSFCLAAVVALTLTACGGSEPTPAPTMDKKDTTTMPKADEKKPEPAAMTPAPAPTPEPAPAPAPAAEPAPAVAPAAAPAAPDTLAGSTWKGPEYTVEFKPGGIIKASGGAATDGIEGTYVLAADGGVTLNAGGMEFKGKYDGTKLTVDDKEYVKQ